MDIVFGKFVTIFNSFAVGELSPEGYRQEVSRYSLYFLYLFIAKFVLSYVWMVRSPFIREWVREALPIPCRTLFK